ncbi:m7GpppN-mRNA hydrolase-like isoform X2 [Mizuhopecten yessoensis]|uniref:m7GpppN-mRNA hydrolase-like isoform X2 n=1 Tax=Mizuhopecten yessoensis TaxID=6573 RepID=UPI000B45E531|nr:m7GpppN-mRNA hydrolase-like isoform X2 [Mizuhopecten yessoensis]
MMISGRFIINIPDEERQDLIRIFFQIELAHWFYLDFYCAENQELRSCGIKDFSAQVFKHCPFLSGHAGEVDKILENWRSYKMSVPTYGAIMLDPELKYVLLVQGFWTKSSWGFPKGKVNEEESPHDCAVREVEEETGFDIVTLIDKNAFLENHFNDQLTRLYIVPGVPLSTKFQPKTRKEIKSLQWFPIEALPAHKHDQTPKQLGYNPNNFFMVIPFIKPLRKWLAGRQNLLDADLSEHTQHSNSNQHKQIKGGIGPNEARHHREKQKQKLQQFFAQQNQQEYQDYLQLNENDSKSRTESVNKDLKSRTESPRKEPYHKGRQLENSDPSQGKKGYHIMNRDGTISGSSRRSLNPQFENSPGLKQGQPYDRSRVPTLIFDRTQPPPSLPTKPQHDRPNTQHMNSPYGKGQFNQKKHKYVKITDPDGLGSEAWLNFHFDISAIMSCIQ